MQELMQDYDQVVIIAGECAPQVRITETNHAHLPRYAGDKKLNNKQHKLSAKERKRGKRNRVVL